MHNSVAAIRAARVTARFVLPPTQQRERHLGLRRLAFTALRPGGRVAGGDGRRSLRAALGGQGGLVPAPIRRSTMSPLRRDASIRWSSDVPSTARRPTARRATPWRG